MRHLCPLCKTNNIDNLRYFSFNIGKVYICLIHPCAVLVVLFFQYFMLSACAEATSSMFMGSLRKHCIFLSSGIFPVDSMAPSENCKLIGLDLL